MSLYLKRQTTMMRRNLDLVLNTRIGKKSTYLVRTTHNVQQSGLDDCIVKGNTACSSEGSLH